MTKLLEQMVAKASVLSEDEQDAVAIHMLEGMAAVKDDAPVPEWQKKILIGRRQARLLDPSRLLTLEQVQEEFERRRSTN